MDFYKNKDLIITSLLAISSLYWVTQYNNKEIKDNEKYLVPIIGNIGSSALILSLEDIIDYKPNEITGNLKFTNYGLSIFHSLLAYWSVNYDFKNKNGERVKDVTKCLPQNQTYDYKILTFLDCDDNLKPEYEHLIGYTGDNFEERKIVDCPCATGATGATGAEQNCGVPQTPPQNCAIQIKDNIFSQIWNLPFAKLTDLLGTFFGITSVFHLIYAKDPGGIYTEIVKNKNNYLRWLEYSITATIMIIVIARSAGVSDEQSIRLITSMMIVVMVQGQFTEMCLNLYTKTKDQETKIQLRNLIIGLQLVGWLLMFSTFSTIITKWNGVVSRLKNFFNAIERETPDVFDFIWIVIYGQLVFFSLFGIIQLYQIYETFRDDNQSIEKYRKYEYMYNILSIVSKAGLGSALFYGLSQATENGDCGC